MSLPRVELDIRNPEPPNRYGFAMVGSIRLMFTEEEPGVLLVRHGNWGYATKRHAQAAVNSVAARWIDAEIRDCTGYGVRPS